MPLSSLISPLARRSPQGEDGSVPLWLRGEFPTRRSVIVNRKGEGRPLQPSDQVVDEAVRLGVTDEVWVSFSLTSSGRGIKRTRVKITVKTKKGSPYHLVSAMS